MNHSAQRTGIDRREMLGSFGLAAAAAMLQESVGRANEPAANVVDCGSAIRITALKANIVRDRVYVRMKGTLVSKHSTYTIR